MFLWLCFLSRVSTLLIRGIFLQISHKTGGYSCGCVELWNILSKMHILLWTWILQKLGQLEVKHGMLQLAETLDFLHNKARVLHRAISPEVSIHFRNYPVLTFCLSWRSMSVRNKSFYVIEIIGLLRLVHMVPVCRLLIHDSLEYLAPRFTHISLALVPSLVRNP